MTQVIWGRRVPEEEDALYTEVPERHVRGRRPADPARWIVRNLFARAVRMIKVSGN